MRHDCHGLWLDQVLHPAQSAYSILFVVAGTLTTDANNVETSTQTTRTKEVTTTKDPKEAAREAALELSKKIFSNITKHLRESIASKDFSVFTTANDNQDEKDGNHISHNTESITIIKFHKISKPFNQNLINMMKITQRLNIIRI